MADTPAVRREQTGAGAKSPPGVEVSGSEGDRNKNSLGPSRFDRRTVRYVANDDGTPISERTDELLEELLGVMKAMLAALEAR